MTKKLSNGLFAVVLLLAISFSSALFAADKSTETKIQTNAYSFMCKDKIEQNIKDIDGVTDCFLNLENKIATITFNPDKVKVETIKEKIVALGYDAEVVIANNSSAEKEQPTRKNLN